MSTPAPLGHSSNLDSSPLQQAPLAGDTFLRRWVLLMLAAVPLTCAPGFVALFLADISLPNSSHFGPRDISLMMLVAGVLLSGGLPALPLIFMTAFGFSYSALIFRIETPASSIIYALAAGGLILIGFRATRLLRTRLQAVYPNVLAIRIRLAAVLALSFVPIIGTIYFYYLVYSKRGKLAA